MARRTGALSAALAATLLASSVALAAPLTVCMAEENPPLSYLAQGTPRGLDVRLAQAVAAELGRELKLVLFESKYEQESSLSHEVNALLSSGVCELASGFVLLKPELGAPSRPTARVPEHPGAPRPPLRPWVPLGSLAGSLAYHAVAMGVVLRDQALPGQPVTSLAGLAGTRIGAITGTMAGTVLSLYRNGLLRPDIVSLSRGQDALQLLESGSLDATLVVIDRFDAWRLAHPASTLRREPYQHPLRINIGFVARADAPEALAAADKVIARALAKGDLQRWSQESGVTWIGPAAPNVGAPVGLADLLRE
jgi:ABC-type amino acid transport substrate-binding protein